MRTFGLSVAFITVVGFVGISGPPLPSPPRPVARDAGAMPSQIRDVLRNKFAGWRPKQLSDLDPDNQKAWLHGANGKACPGVAVGHFESAKQDSYALLLVPDSEATRGYKVVVLTKESSGESYVPKLLDSADGDTYSGVVISKVDPGTFSDLDDGRKIQTMLDGVIVEWIEKGAVLYYWSADRYRRVTIAD
jgi:hypothetical protein